LRHKTISSITIELKDK